MSNAVISVSKPGRYSRESISLQQISKSYGRDHNLHEKITPGRAILDDSRLLEQYIFSYAQMTQRMWGHFLPDVKAPEGRFRLIDYGCGQALACSILFDHFGKDITRQIHEIILVEPSRLALNRAKEIIKAYDESLVIVEHCKKLDELTRLGHCFGNYPTTLHLMSYVLDIDDFDHLAIFRKIAHSRGRHYILAVSPFREKDGGAPRFRDSEDHVYLMANSGVFSILKSRMIEKFESRVDEYGLSWQLEIEV
jgi:hypothetical protein